MSPNGKSMVSLRAGQAKAFLARAGWGAACVRPLAGDLSQRRYQSLTLDGRRAVLMDWPPAPPIPGMERYARRARQAVRLPPFRKIGNWLRQRQLSAPEIHAYDTGAGFALLEDLGRRAYGALLQGGQAPALYRAAISVLLVLARATPPASLAPRLSESVFLAEAMLLPESLSAPASEAKEYQARWRRLWKRLDHSESCLVLRDFHSPNLLWLPKRQGAAKAGLLDYQDALIGPSAYDLASLLQDARLTVPLKREKYWQAFYIRERQNQRGFDAAAFRVSYAILAAQRACKIAGVFRVLRQRTGRAGYIRHLPRLALYLARNAALVPELEVFASWLKRAQSP